MRTVRGGEKLKRQKLWEIPLPADDFSSKLKSYHRIESGAKNIDQEQMRK